MGVGARQSVPRNGSVRLPFAVAPAGFPDWPTGQGFEGTVHRRADYPRLILRLDGVQLLGPEG